NLAAYVDHVVLGSRVAATGTNPEGLLSTFPALVTVLIGYWGGRWLRTRPLSSATSRRLALAGLAVAAAGALCHPLFPFNKRLWTSSYVLFSGGLGLLLLVVTYEVVGVLRSRRHGWK